MILHLVTDRQRLAPGSGVVAATACLVDQVRQATAAGVDVVQLRERDLEGRALAELVRALVAVTRASATRLVVNDRLDVALACGADGIHLRSDSVDAGAVRASAPPGFLVGRSVHGVDAARQAGPVDYLLAGTVLPTMSKPEGHRLLGIHGLAAIVEAVAVPVLAIGGVSQETLARMAHAGAAGIAGIGLFLGESGGCRAIPLKERVETFRRAFAAGNMEPPADEH